MVTSGAGTDGDRAGGVVDRLAMADELLSGLALPGSPERVVLDRARRGMRSEVADLVAAIDVVSGQARLAAEAGRTAGQRSSGAAWLAVTAPHWHEYLGWLRDELAALQAQADQIGGWARHQVDAALRAAREECQAARLQWVPIAQRY